MRIFCAAGVRLRCAVAALIAALQPLTAAALAGPVLGERVDRRQWVGLAVGLIGVAIVVSDSLTGRRSAPAWAYALPFLAMTGLVAATLLERRLEHQGALVQGLTVQCAVSAGLFSLLAVAEGQASPPATPDFWIAIAWVVVLSTFGGYSLYWINLRRHGITRVSSLIYLTPPTTLLWALLMFDQPISIAAIAASPSASPASHSSNTLGELDRPRQPLARAQTTDPVAQPARQSAYAVAEHRARSSPSTVRCGRYGHLCAGRVQLGRRGRHGGGGGRAVQRRCVDVQ